MHRDPRLYFDRVDQRLFFERSDDLVYRVALAREHLLARRVVKTDRDPAAQAQCGDHIFDHFRFDREHRDHDPARTFVVKPAALVNHLQGVLERQRADMDEVIEFAEAQTERPIGTDAGPLQQA